jgi:Tol biopolymer transport system component
VRPSRPLFPPLAVAVVLAGCSNEYPNPFASGNQTVPPGAQAALFLASGVYSTAAGAPREVYAANADGASLSRLTFCNVAAACDTLEVIPSAERNRVLVRRVTDSDRDGRLDAAADGEALVFIDLARSVEAVVVPAAQRVSGADWTIPDLVVYSGNGEGGLEDLFTVMPNGTNTRVLTATADVRERRPRVDPSGQVAVYERIEGDGKGLVYIFANASSQARVTTGGAGTEVLPGTPYVVGGDADPDYSPDGRGIVFRRLTATGNGGLGTWDLMRVSPDGTGLTTLASGPVYRGAPDWTARGIAFVEIDVAAGRAELVSMQADGTGRAVLLTQGASFRLASPRWLP